MKTTRRNVLTTGLGAFAGMLSPRLLAQEPHIPPFRKPETPAQALELLVRGNHNYLNEDLTSFAADRAILREHTQEKQEPFAALLSCADSRVPPEIVFDQTIGHLFVVRVAGNIVTPDTVASLEYATAVLGVKMILVLGHTDCGAIKAAAAVKEVPGEISALYQYLHPATRTGVPLDQASADNAIIQAALLREASPVIRPLVQAGTFTVVPAIYSVATGAVTLLEQPSNGWNHKHDDDALVAHH